MRPRTRARISGDSSFRVGLLFRLQHLKNHTLPLKCDELGVPMPFTDNNDAHGPEYIMSARCVDYLRPRTACLP